MISSGPSTTGCPGRPPYTARARGGCPTNMRMTSGVTSGASPSVTISFEIDGLPPPSAATPQRSDHA